MKRRLLIAVVALLGASGTANAGMQYSATLLGTLGGSQSYAQGINNSGQVVGWASTANNAYHATIWNGGVATDLGTLGGSQSYAQGINNSGQVVGIANTAGSAYHNTLWNGTVATDLGAAGYYKSIAINDLGQVAGSNAANEGVLWSGSSVTNLVAQGYYGQNLIPSGINNAGTAVGFAYPYETFGNAVSSRSGLSPLGRGTLGQGFLRTYSEGSASGINSSGQIVGFSRTSVSNGDPYVGGNPNPPTLGARHAVIWNGSGSPTDLGGSFGGESYALGINNFGQVVGSAEGHAITWNGSSPTDLNTALFSIGSGWVLTTANGINDLGQIVGNATNMLTGATQGFLLTPSAVPIPAAAWLMVSGLGALGAAARRRKTLAVQP